MKSNLLTLFHLGFCCLLWNWKFRRVFRLVTSLSERSSNTPRIGRIWSRLDYGLYSSSLLPRLAGDLCKISASVSLWSLPSCLSTESIRHCQCVTMTLLTSDVKGKVMGLKHRGQNRKVAREVLWKYRHWCCSQIPGSGLLLLMSGDSGGTPICVQPAQGSCREKRSCADGKDEPDLSSLCRAGESDALFWKQAQYVEKPCRRRPISMQTWGQKVVARLWPAPVNTRAQHGPRLGCAVRDI